MRTGRALGVVLSLLAGAALSRAEETYPLAEKVQVGDCFHVHIEMALEGELRVSKDGKTVPLPLRASAAHDYSERVLNVGPTGLAERSARVYEEAWVNIVGEKDGTKRTLRPERRLMVAERLKDEPLVYSPAGPLTREEVELIGEHFDSLYLTGLLPGKAVAVGETWKAPNTVAQALCHFEGLTEQSLVCKLEEVKGNSARVSVNGTATGIDAGALAKLKITATYHFNLETKRLSELDWKQQDEREQGPASPASAVKVSTVLKRKPIEQPRSLSDVALVSVPGDMNPPEPMLQLEHRDPKDRYEMVFGREWHLVSQTEEHTVLRLLDRGDFVAQLTVTPWTPAEKGKHLSPEAFKEAMAETPGWVPDKELQAGEVPAEDKDGRWIYRLSALGQMDGVAVLQNFYLVAAPTGEQVVLVFTMAPKQAERLGSRDLAIVGSLEFPSCRKERPKQP